MRREEPSPTNRLEGGSSGRRYSVAHVVILEDNLLLQARMVSILNEAEFCETTSCAATVADCTKLLQTQHADVLLADLHLPDGSGRECIKLFNQINPDGVSIVISALSDGESIVQALEFGAIGYLHKDDTSFQIIDAIKMALNGQSPMSPSIAYALISRIQDASVPAAPQQVVVRSSTTLTKRELEVLNMIAKGLSYSETAKYLDISAQTVPVHIRNIYKKLQATNRAEAVFEARAIGLIE